LKTAQFRFYAELNDFLPPEKKQERFFHRFSGKPSVKDAIEGLGIPHTEVELILANGRSVGFGYPLADGDRIAVYPVFESLDVSPVIRLREKPLRKTAFVLDVHLGKLSRLLRMLGLDTLYRRDYEDGEIVDLSVDEHRIVLTRDQGLLKRAAVTHGYWVRSAEPVEQAKEVLSRFDLFSQVSPFARCIRCNGIIQRIDSETVPFQLPPRVASCCAEYFRCSDCEQVYWKGSHYDRMQETICEILSSGGAAPRVVDP
jgi:uncharacterized protein with PIN domain